MLMRRSMLLIAAASVTAAIALGPTADAQEPQPTTPIHHFVFLMQENHSFDNYFGTFPGADGIPEGVCMPISLKRPEGRCLRPFHIGHRAVIDLGHSQTVFDGQLDCPMPPGCSETVDGRMDGFVSELRDTGTDPRTVMGHYDQRDLPFYWNLARNYVLFDRFFSSAGGGSVWNHFYWVTGTPGNPKRDTLPRQGFGELPTIFDRLQAAGISWKFYVQNYDPTITYRTFRQPGLENRASQVVWVPLLNYARYIDDPAKSSKIVDLSQYFVDLENNELPSVAFIVPAGSSEHPPGSIQSGQRFVRTLIYELMRSSAWDSAAFMWTYDDWGGWYDHVPPPQIDQWGYGFRVPALLVSPYARQGFVDSTTLDYTSGLKFIEQNWALAPLARRDREANSISGAFDFTAPPRAPRLLPDAAEPISRDVGKPRGVIFLTYGLAIAGALALVATVGFATPLRRRRSR